MCIRDSGNTQFLFGFQGSVDQVSHQAHAGITRSATILAQIKDQELPSLISNRLEDWLEKFPRFYRLSVIYERINAKIARVVAYSLVGNGIFKVANTRIGITKCRPRIKCDPVDGE